MNVSSYIHGTSFYHRYDVRPKIVSTLLFSVAVFLMSSWIGFAMAFSIPVLIMLLSVGPRETLRCCMRLLPLFIILLLFIPLQERSGSPLWTVNGVVVITAEGVWTTCRIIARLGGISWMLMLLLLTERNEDIIKGLRAFHLPYNAALAASMILRFIPYLGYLFSEIRDSMSLRLEEGKRGYPILPSITALTVSAIRMIPETAASLEERGFGLGRSNKGSHMVRPSHYFTQWALGVIIPLSLLLVR